MQGTPESWVRTYVSEKTRAFRATLGALGVAESEYFASFQQVVELALSDLAAIVDSDPAAAGNERYVRDTYSMLRAVMDYRVANSIFRFQQDGDLAQLFKSEARKISEASRDKFTVDIHPGAQIGRRFRLDHGANTVIGETCEIGEDCVILQAVVLGAKSASEGAHSRRHPKLGNGVQVLGFAKIFGSVTIGDNATIGPDSVVLFDVAAGATVKRIHSVQIETGKDSRTQIFGVVPTDSAGQLGLRIYGIGLELVQEVKILCRQAMTEVVKFDFLHEDNQILISRARRVTSDIRRPVLQLGSSSSQLILHDSLGLDEFCRRLMA